MSKWALFKIPSLNGQVAEFDKEYCKLLRILPSRFPLPHMLICSSIVCSVVERREKAASCICVRTFSWKELYFSHQQFSTEQCFCKGCLKGTQFRLQGLVSPPYFAGFQLLQGCFLFYGCCVLCVVFFLMKTKNKDFTKRRYVYLIWVQYFLPAEITVKSWSK